MQMTTKERRKLIYEILKATEGMHESFDSEGNFWLIEGWGTIEKFMYELVCHIAGCGLASKYYDGAMRYGKLDHYNEDAGGPIEVSKGIPLAVKDAFDAAELAYEFDDIMPDRWGFTDEYSRCYYCNRAVRVIVNPGEPVNYVRYKGREVCEHCIKNRTVLRRFYISEIEGDPHRLNRIDIAEELRAEGYKKEAEMVKPGELTKVIYSVSMHETKQVDDPAEVMMRLKEKFDYVVFNEHEVQQFEIRWIAWVKNEE